MLLHHHQVCKSTSAICPFPILAFFLLLFILRVKASNILSLLKSSAIMIMVMVIEEIVVECNRICIPSSSILLFFITIAVLISQGDGDGANQYQRRPS